MVREVFPKKLKTGNPEALGSGGPYKAEIWFPGAFMIYLDATKKLSEKPYIWRPLLHNDIADEIFLVWQVA